MALYFIKKSTGYCRRILGGYFNSRTTIWSLWALHLYLPYYLFSLVFEQFGFLFVKTFIMPKALLIM